jgi:retron-type reverse transcriptase
LNLKEELINKTYNPGGYRYFRVYDPKERQIAVAPFRDRVIHHAVVNILEPIYEKSFIYDSYATRPEKGVHKAILRTQEFLRNNERYLRTDIKRYFDSVNHSTLLDILRRKIKDNDLLWLLEKIIKAVPEDKGIPIGNLREDWGQVLNYKFF